MALLPLPGHARALFRPLLPFQPARKSQWPLKDPRQHPRLLPASALLHSVQLRWDGKLDLQHDLPYSRLPCDGEAGLLRSWGKCALRAVLHTDPHLSARPDETTHQADAVAAVDVNMHPAIRCARSLPYAMELGLHIQHGSQCGSRSIAKYFVECLQYPDLPEAEEAVGCLAWLDCGVDHFSDELGAA